MPNGIKKRPKIALEKTTADILLEICGWSGLIALWILVVLNYPALPETIAVHFNILGEADRFGNKSFLLLLPIIATIIFILLTVLARYPHTFNYPVQITADNAERQYRIATQMFRCLKLAIVIMFGLILVSIIRNPTGETNEYSIWMLPTLLALIFIPVIYFLIKAFRDSK